ncbi:monovalent cation/H+ antiporter complex subunit F [Parvularcula lutaonensis]|uniref:Monovalent cation/H+ antiporter complex subunit F n=1 Tax=Parvularcula lutaonensis TaxID=491923 RepID=A0ABV7MEI8_9PROT|nr:monovalent cation/H+ antiporter complex subunit F [Parvularcula lutaonensis]GGY54803.1 pH regulation protein F [Parvularcula lutaonensis]
MFTAAAAAIIVAMIIMLFRAIAGPTVYDRVLSVNSFGTKTVLLLAVLGFLMGRPAFLDIALLYALINFIATIAILKFFRYGRLSASMADMDLIRGDRR